MNPLRAAKLEGAAKSFWEREFANLTKISNQLIEAGDIGSQRAAFALLSDEMLVLTNAFDLGAAMPLYELHCPMAFEGRGATWLQANDQVRNPFYGATHLKCANRVQRIGSTSKNAPVEGHKH